ncbi:PadR family transcriptional regulator [Edaphobacter modestus]|nr:PadR family transcriptional regulator [Edaphobacter modestus]
MKRKTTAAKAEDRTGTATPDALLGVLSMAPMSGYTIRSVIAQSIGNFWNESYGQIYPALKKLTAEGLVQKKTERQKGRPDRNVYSLTGKGRERLKEWVMVPAAAEVPRNELLLKLFFGGHAPVSASRESVAAFVATQQEAVARYSEIAKEVRRERPDDPQARFWLMTVSYGRHYSEALVKWGRETLKELDAIDSGVRKKTSGRKRSTRLKQ